MWAAQTKPQFTARALFRRGRAEEVEQLGVAHTHSCTGFDGETTPGNGKHSKRLPEREGINLEATGGNKTGVVNTVTLVTKNVRRQEIKLENINKNSASIVWEKYILKKKKKKSLAFRRKYCKNWPDCRPYIFKYPIHPTVHLVHELPSFRRTGMTTSHQLVQK